MPLDVFPSELEQLVYQLDSELMYRPEYTAASILFATATALGHTSRIQLQPGWIENNCIFIALVGTPGSGKSHPLKRMIKPIEILDSNSYKEVQDIEDEKERKRKRRQHLVGDATPEEVARLHSVNPRGLGLRQDELSRWMKGFNKYNSSADEDSTWLEIWSGGEMRIDRKTTSSFIVANASVSVVGGIQPRVLSELFTDAYVNSGFFDRFLFTIPADMGRRKVPMKQFSQVPPGLAVYDDMITAFCNRLYHPEEHDDEINLNPVPETAYRIFYEWQHQRVDNSQHNSDPIVDGLGTKVESYALRFANLLQAIHDYYQTRNNARNAGISDKCMQDGIRLAEWFEAQALNILQSVIQGSAVDKLDTIWQVVYNSLPDEFDKAKAVSVVAEVFSAHKKAPPSARTVRNRLLSQDKLLKKISHGRYSKLL